MDYIDVNINKIIEVGQDITTLTENFESKVEDLFKKLENIKFES